MEAPNPMELRAVDAIPDGTGWLYEPKWDGFRAIAVRDGDDVAIFSKAGQPLGRYFPEVVAALGTLAVRRFTIDGELVVPEAGALSFDTLQQRIHPAASRVAMLARTHPARYLIFDLLRDGDDDVASQPLSLRREKLDAFARRFAPNDVLRRSPASTSRNDVDDWFARVGGALDGVVAKRLDAPYPFGSRDGGVKIKKQRTADCVIGGYRTAAGSDELVGSLLLGLYNDEGTLDYIGFSSAFPAAERKALVARLAPYLGGSGFDGAAPGGTPSRWNRDRERDRSYVALQPELVLEVGFDQVTAGRIRHGTRPLRWRTDKSPRDCTTDQLAVLGNVFDLVDAG